MTCQSSWLLYGLHNDYLELLNKIAMKLPTAIFFRKSI